MNKSKNISEQSSRKKKSKGIAGISLIFFLIDKLQEAVYNALVNGFFGYIFTSYSSELSAYKNGYIVSYFKGSSKTGRLFRKIREYISGNFENSFILGKLRATVCGMAFLPLKTYGTFFLSFGIYTLLVYFFKTLLPATGVANIDDLFAGIIICIVALPIYASRSTLARAVQRGRITNAVFVDAFGYREENFENKYGGKKKHSGTSILLGLLAGILTFIVEPLTIVLYILAFLVITLVIITPEIGVLATLFLIPFLSFFNSPALLLAILVIVTTFSYFIKLIRGKRILKLELIDFVVLLFLIMTYFSGAITVGGIDSYYSAVISCFLMFGYFLIANLIRTEKWLHRCILALVSSATIVSMIGIAQYLLGLSVNDWLDTSYFYNISGRTTSLFENPNYLAAYLALIFPFALYQILVSKSKKEKALSFAACLIVFICNILTWSRASWLAMLITIVIFLIVLSKKTMRWIIGIVAAIPFLPFILPKNIVTRFMSIGNMADSSTLYRVYTWKGSLQMAKEYFWGGIGYGPDAFAQLYPVYAYAGIESAPHSHSLYLQILISMGIGGLICFCIIPFLYAQKSIEYLKMSNSRDSFLITFASLLSVICLLVMGLFDYVWYNYRIFFLFWAVIAIGVACIRIGKKEMSRCDIHKYSNEYAASVDINVN
ncbi:MAG: O-antigen ligase family protein [Clostridia bacterium]|nr:O-antigen ligase family protein [Clostridia bacterium]